MNLQEFKELITSGIPTEEIYKKLKEANEPPLLYGFIAYKYGVSKQMRQMIVSMFNLREEYYDDNFRKWVSEAIEGDRSSIDKLLSMGKDKSETHRRRICAMIVYNLSSSNYIDIVKCIDYCGKLIGLENQDNKEAQKDLCQWVKDFGFKKMDDYYGNTILSA